MADNRPADTPPMEAVRIAPIPKRAPLIFLFAGPITGLLTHWIQGKSSPCPGSDDCPTSVHKGRTMWKGYAPGRKWDAAGAVWVAAVAEVTEVLEEQLRGRQLRGEVWMLERHNERKKTGPCRGVFLTTRDDPALLEVFDIRPALYRFYDTRAIELGIPNPLPPKVFLPTVAAAGPPVEAPASPMPAPAPTPDQYDEIRRFAARHRAANPSPNGKR